MPNISDPVWGVIGVIAAIVFGVFGIIGVIIALLQLIQSSKRITYEFLSTTPILKIVSGFQEQIEIRLGGQLVKDVHLVIVQFSSSGRASIRSDDFERPLKLSVLKGQIISADIVNTEPESLGEIIEARDKSSVTFKKILLNSNDKFDIKLLISEFSGETKDIQIDGRVVGVKAIKETKESLIVQSLLKSSPLVAWMVTLLMPLSFVPALGGLISAFLLELVSQPRHKKRDKLP